MKIYVLGTTKKKNRKKRCMSNEARYVVYLSNDNVIVP